jgi:hypothetical protein
MAMFERIGYKRCNYSEAFKEVELEYHLDTHDLLGTKQKEGGTDGAVTGDVNAERMGRGVDFATLVIQNPVYAASMLELEANPEALRRKREKEERMQRKRAEERQLAQKVAEQAVLSSISQPMKTFTIFKRRILPLLEAEGLAPGKVTVLESARRWKLARQDKSELWVECEQAAKDDALRYEEQAMKAVAALRLDDGAAPGGCTEPNCQF